MLPFDMLVLKTYSRWTLYLHERQSYLGRAYAWLTREGDRQCFSQLTTEERAELFEAVLPEYERAIEKLFQPDHMNYAWLGNEFHMHGGHGHLHLIPRYARARNFKGMRFTDERWGKNYAPTSAGVYQERNVLNVRDALRAELNR